MLTAWEDSSGHTHTEITRECRKPQRAAECDWLTLSTIFLEHDMTRNTPCKRKLYWFPNRSDEKTWAQFHKVCKKRRRKCYRRTGSTVCVLCEKLGFECDALEEGHVDVDSEHDDMIAVDGSEELRYWQDQMLELQLELRRLEAEKLQLLNATTAWRNNNEAVNQMLPRFGWRMSINNGYIRLETGIKNISELLSSIQPSLYHSLSPFGSSCSFSEPLSFEGHSCSFIPAFVRLMSQWQNEKAHIRYPSQIEQIAFINIRQLTDKLVDIYFEKFNPVRPYIHAPSFLTYYKTLKNPLDSEVTLAICTYVCISPWSGLRFSPAEKRQIADFFYSKCKERLLDFLDDDTPRPLEALVAVNLLQPYILLARLCISEARRLLTMSYLIANDLKGIYNDPETPLVERAIFQRNYLHAYSALRFLDYAVEGKYTDDLDVPYSNLLVIPDESQATRDYLQVYNEIFRFLTSPFLKEIMVSGEYGKASAWEV